LTLTDLTRAKDLNRSIHLNPYRSEVAMNESQATAKGLTQIWVSTGTKHQEKLAYTIADQLRSKGVTAEVIPTETLAVQRNAVWRDTAFMTRCKEEENEPI